jgi:molybdenum cofactor biosynthesis protein B
VAVAQHRSSAPAASAIRVAVISASDSRTLRTDAGGALIEALATQAGFSVTARELLPDDKELIRAQVSSFVATNQCDVVLVTGGTGVAPRDSTVEAVAPLFERRLDGFGELFRMLSFAEIGPAAMLSRAGAGTIGRVAVFLMPGSPAAVRLALERLILPELAHLVGELRRQSGGGVSPFIVEADPSNPDHVHAHGHGQRDPG